MPHAVLTVLTGDIVGSSRMKPADLDAAMDTLAAAVSEIVRRWGEGRAHFTRFRGDGWQSLGPSPEFVLRAVLLLRARVRTLGRFYDTRISAGIGTGRVVPGADLSQATGPAFEVAGAGLDDMGHSPRFAIASEEPDRGGGLPVSATAAIFALCDEISRRWTPRQAEVFSHRLLTDPTQKEIAAALGVTQQSIARHLHAGGDWALSRALETVEKNP